jgi:predicted negative regulator of RcsB-dependent stress response
MPAERIAGPTGPSQAKCGRVERSPARTTSDPFVWIHLLWAVPLLLAVLSCWLVLSPALAYARGDLKMAKRAAARLLAVPILGSIKAVAEPARLVVGNACLHEGDAAAALPAFEAAANAKNATVSSLARIGIAGSLHRLEREPERALTILDHVFADGWRASPSEKLLRAHLLLSLGRTEEADAVFAEVQKEARTQDAHAAALREKSERDYVSRRQLHSA